MHLVFYLSVHCIGVVQTNRETICLSDLLVNIMLKHSSISYREENFAP